jgi:hypothetical protein
MNEVKWNFVEKMLDIEKKFNDYSITLHSKRKEYKWYEKKMITGVNTAQVTYSKCHIFYMLEWILWKIWGVNAFILDFSIRL